VEVFTGQRRRSWSDEEKAAITAESLAPGVNVSEVARRRGVSIGLLHYWRRQSRRRSGEEPLQFIPVLASSEAPSAATPPAGGSMQIDYGGARIRVTGAVDPKALAAVLSALQAQA
jgi:transposase